MTDCKLKSVIIHKQLHGSITFILLGLYRIADFTIQPNKNNSFYYLAEYE